MVRKPNTLMQKNSLEKRLYSNNFKNSLDTKTTNGIVLVTKGHHLKGFLLHPSAHSRQGGRTVNHTIRRKL